MSKVKKLNGTGGRNSPSGTILFAPDSNENCYQPPKSEYDCLLLSLEDFIQEFERLMEIRALSYWNSVDILSALRFFTNSLTEVFQGQEFCGEGSTTLNGLRIRVARLSLSELEGSVYSVVTRDHDAKPT